ncbi:uncharacterized protein [Apostichopus japonicus]|uniref:uncharacterized protein isoform X2 n=1 Tax=Stichopus japonicus TaxID=307972 RepID=UPI003AB335FD
MFYRRTNNLLLLMCILVYGVSGDIVRVESEKLDKRDIWDRVIGNISSILRRSLESSDILYSNTTRQLIQEENNTGRLTGLARMITELSNDSYHCRIYNCSGVHQRNIETNVRGALNKFMKDLSRYQTLAKNQQLTNRSIDTFNNNEEIFNLINDVDTPKVEFDETTMRKFKEVFLQNLDILLRSHVQNLKKTFSDQLMQQDKSIESYASATYPLESGVSNKFSGNSTKRQQVTLSIVERNKLEKNLQSIKAYLEVHDRDVKANVINNLLHFFSNLSHMRSSEDNRGQKWTTNSIYRDMGKYFEETPSEAEELRNSTVLADLFARVADVIESIKKPNVLTENQVNTGSELSSIIRSIASVADNKQLLSSFTDVMDLIEYANDNETIYKFYPTIKKNQQRSSNNPTSSNNGISSNDVTSNNNVTSSNDVKARHGVETSNEVTAINDITWIYNVASSNDVTPNTDVISNHDVISRNDVTASDAETFTSTPPGARDRLKDMSEEDIKMADLINILEYVISMIDTTDLKQVKNLVHFAFDLTQFMSDMNVHPMNMNMLLELDELYHLLQTERNVWENVTLTATTQNLIRTYPYLDIVSNLSLMISNEDTNADSNYLKQLNENQNTKEFADLPVPSYNRSSSEVSESFTPIATTETSGKLNYAAASTSKGYSVSSRMVHEIHPSIMNQTNGSRQLFPNMTTPMNSIKVLGIWRALENLQSAFPNATRYDIKEFDGLLAELGKLLANVSKVKYLHNNSNMISFEDLYDALLYMESQIEPVGTNATSMTSPTYTSSSPFIEGTSSLSKISFEKVKDLKPATQIPSTEMLSSLNELNHVTKTESSTFAAITISEKPAPQSYTSQAFLIGYDVDASPDGPRSSSGEILPNITESRNVMNLADVLRVLESAQSNFTKEMRDNVTEPERNLSELGTILETTTEATQSSIQSDVISIENLLAETSSKMKSKTINSTRNLASMASLVHVSELSVERGTPTTKVPLTDIAGSEGKLSSSEFEFILPWLEAKFQKVENSSIVDIIQNYGKRIDLKIAAMPRERFNDFLMKLLMLENVLEESFTTEHDREALLRSPVSQGEHEDYVTVISPGEQTTTETRLDIQTLTSSPDYSSIKHHVVTKQAEKKNEESTALQEFKELLESNGTLLTAVTHRHYPTTQENLKLPHLSNEGDEGTEKVAYQTESRKQEFSDLLTNISRYFQHTGETFTSLPTSSNPYNSQSEPNQSMTSTETGTTYFLSSSGQHLPGDRELFTQGNVVLLEKSKTENVPSSVATSQPKLMTQQKSHDMHPTTPTSIISDFLTFVTAEEAKETIRVLEIYRDIWDEVRGKGLNEEPIKNSSIIEIIQNYEKGYAEINKVDHSSIDSLNDMVMKLLLLSNEVVTSTTKQSKVVLSKSAHTEGNEEYITVPTTYLGEQETIEPRLETQKFTPSLLHSSTEATTEKYEPKIAEPTTPGYLFGLLAANGSFFPTTALNDSLKQLSVSKSSQVEPIEPRTNEFSKELTPLSLPFDIGYATTLSPNATMAWTPGTNVNHIIDEIEMIFNDLNTMHPSYEEFESSEEFKKLASDLLAEVRNRVNVLHRFPGRQHINMTLSLEKDMEEILQVLQSYESVTNGERKSTTPVEFHFLQTTLPPLKVNTQSPTQPRLHSLSNLGRYEGREEESREKLMKEFSDLLDNVPRYFQHTGEPFTSLPTSSNPYNSQSEPNQPMTFTETGTTYFLSSSGQHLPGDRELFTQENGVLLAKSNPENVPSSVATSQQKLMTQQKSHDRQPTTPTSIISDFLTSVTAENAEETVPGLEIIRDDLNEVPLTSLDENTIEISSTLGERTTGGDGEIFETLAELYTTETNETNVTPSMKQMEISSKGEKYFSNEMTTSRNNPRHSEIMNEGTIASATEVTLWTPEIHGSSTGNTRTVIGSANRNINLTTQSSTGNPRTPCKHPEHEGGIFDVIGAAKINGGEDVEGEEPQINEVFVLNVAQIDEKLPTDFLNFVREAMNDEFNQPTTEEHNGTPQLTTYGVSTAVQNSTTDTTTTSMLMLSSEPYSKNVLIDEEEAGLPFRGVIANLNNKTESMHESQIEGQIYDEKDADLLNLIWKLGNITLNFEKNEEMYDKFAQIISKKISLDDEANLLKLFFSELKDTQTKPISSTDNITRSITENNTVATVIQNISTSGTNGINNQGFKEIKSLEASRNLSSQKLIPLQRFLGLLKMNNISSEYMSTISKESQVIAQLLQKSSESGSGQRQYKTFIQSIEKLIPKGISANAEIHILDDLFIHDKWEMQAIGNESAKADEDAATKEGKKINFKDQSSSAKSKIQLDEEFHEMVLHYINNATTSSAVTGSPWIHNVTVPTAIHPHPDNVKGIIEFNAQRMKNLQISLHPFTIKDSLNISSHLLVGFENFLTNHDFYNLRIAKDVLENEEQIKSMLVNISKAIDGLTHVVQELVKEYPEKKTSSIGVDEDEVLRKQGVTVAIGEMPVGQYEDWMSSKQNPKKDNASFQTNGIKGIETGINASSLPVIISPQTFLQLVNGYRLPPLTTETTLQGHVSSPPSENRGLEEVVKKFNDEWRQIRVDLETIGNLSRNHWKETQTGDVAVSGNSARVNRININGISLEAKDNSLAERFDGWMKSYSTSINETASQDNSSISWPPANVFVEADNLSTHGMNQTLFDQLLGATDDFTSTDTNHLQIHNPEDSNTNSFNVQKWADIFKTNGKPTTTIDSFGSSGTSWARWSNWSSWGQCSVTCGRGEKVRRRRCEMVIEGFPIPADSCIGSSEEVAACDVKACLDADKSRKLATPSWTDWSKINEGSTTTIDSFGSSGSSWATWSDWSSWGQCSVTCGRGEKVRRRRCEMVIEGFPIPADSCIGSSEEVAACEVKACHDADKSRKLATPSWTEWSTIHAKPTTTIHLFGSSVDLSVRWSDWSSWGQCSVTCGRGEKVRRRRCEMVIEGLPIPADSCIGSSEEVAACEVKACHDADKSRKLATPSWTEWSTIHAKPTTTIHLFGPSVDLSVRWSDWSSWGQCSVTCGRGEKVRRRRCEMVIEGLPIPADSCIGSSEEVAACKEKACHGDDESSQLISPSWADWSNIQEKTSTSASSFGLSSTSWVRWSDWSSWGQCSVTCGRGKKVRKRRCEMVIEGFPIPADSCIGSSEEVAACDVKACLDADKSRKLTTPSWTDWSKINEGSTTTIDSFGSSGSSWATWSDWSSWGQCSVTCGRGEKVRRRRCEMVIEGFPIPADSCIGSSEEVAACEVKACHDADKSRKLATPSWTEWSTIHAKPTTTIHLYGSSVNLSVRWSDWSSWGQCSVTCGRGEKVRRRRCEMVIEGLPIPADSCIGSSEEVAACEVKACHDADKSRKLATPSWTKWSTIHAKPSTTIHSFGSSVDLSVRWSDWSSWGQCSVTCGRGEKVRRRRCEMVIEGLPIPADSCIGSSEEVAACKEKACHGDDESSQLISPSWADWSNTQEKTSTSANSFGLSSTSWVRWSDWSSWGQCSVTCGRGKKVRKRRCEMVIEGFPIPADSCIGSSEEVAACEVKACLGDDESSQLISPSWADWSNTQEKTSTTANSFGLSKTSRVRWSDWSTWGECSVTCGSGRKVRGRRCEMVIEGFLIPADSCFGPPEEVAACEMKACLDITKSSQLIPPTWAEWSTWGQCSVSCGSGVRSRRRLCRQGDQTNTCLGEAAQAEQCIGDLGVSCPKTPGPSIKVANPIYAMGQKQSQSEPVKPAHQPSQVHLTAGTISSIVAGSILALLLIMACGVAHGSKLLGKAKRRASRNDLV